MCRQRLPYTFAVATEHLVDAESQQREFARVNAPAAVLPQMPVGMVATSPAIGHEDAEAFYGATQQGRQARRGPERPGYAHTAERSGQGVLLAKMRAVLAEAASELDRGDRADGPDATSSRGHGAGGSRWPGARPPMRDLSLVKCHRCQQKGHLAKDCTAPKPVRLRRTQ